MTEMEEEVDFSNLTTATSMDAATDRKHAAMLERLSNLHQSRLARKSNADASPNPSFESTRSFLSRFSESKLSIESQLSCIQQKPTDSDSKSDVERVSVSISDLGKLVAENSYFLPPFEVRTCLKTISDLKQTLETVTTAVVPRKKFSFKNKPPKKETSTNSVVRETVQIQNQKDESEKIPFFQVRDSPGFRGNENEVLAKEFKGGLEGIEEFSVSDLNGCEVRLMGSLRTLFVHKLKNCTVYVGPVLGSILIEEVEESVFVLASHQIRIHHARGCDFYLRVRSRPIIEDSRELRFAPYCLYYDGIERDLEEANLGEETGNWGHVDDFRWLRAVQSPNWSVLPNLLELASFIPLEFCFWGWGLIDILKGPVPSQNSTI